MGRIAIGGSLAIPENPTGAVLFLVGGPAERRDPLRLQVADYLHHAGFATVVSSVVLNGEDPVLVAVERLADRMAHGLRWMAEHPSLTGLPVGCFAEGTAVAPALLTSARSAHLSALVSQGGRPDLGETTLGRVSTPTLLIVGEHAGDSLAANRTALRQIAGPVELAVFDGLDDPMGDPGGIDTMCVLARRWFREHLGPGS